MSKSCIDTQISLSGNTHYDDAVRKHGKEFADSVVETEAQLHIDNFSDYEKHKV